jgi:hypothetical protein
MRFVWVLVKLKLGSQSEIEANSNDKTNAKGFIEQKFE